MFFRRRIFGKYLVILTTIWALYTIFFSSHDKLEINQEIIEKVVEKAIEHQEQHEEAKAAEKVQLKENEKINPIAPHADHDHPEEELKKADEQNRNPDRIVQLNAPDVHDLNAPGMKKKG